MCLSVKHSSALAKFRCGDVPLRLETNRSAKLPIKSRLCRFFKTTVEDEIHVLLFV